MKGDFRLANMALSIAITFAVSLGSSVPAQATPICTHEGDNDPLTENFALWPWNGGMVTTALADDNGWAAWQITNTSYPGQAVYLQAGGTGPYLPEGSGLTQEQVDDVLANGCILSARVRIIDGPVYDESGTQEACADIGVAGFDNYRYDIALGSDGQGNTLMILPQNIHYHGSYFGYEPFGSPLLVPGTDYHHYQLSYDPLSQTADLYIDGVIRATGFPGATVTGGAVANNFGLAFGATGLATANFAFVQLESGTLAATGAEDAETPARSFALYQNVPNPFNPMTRIFFDVPAGGGEVTLRVYDVNGRLVCTLVERYYAEGRMTVAWDGRDDGGQDVASGVYFCRMTALGIRQSRTMVLVR